MTYPYEKEFNPGNFIFVNYYIQRECHYWSQLLIIDTYGYILFKDLSR